MEYVSRCPTCSSLVRRGQDWCTLCHADLRPPEQHTRAAAPAEAEAEAVALPEESPHTLLVDDGETSGKHARSGPVVAIPTPPDDAEISALMAQLAAESQDPLGGIMSRLPDTQSMRVVWALSIGGGIAVLLVLISWVLGLIFG